MNLAEHTLKVAVLRVREDQAKAEHAAARAQAEKAYATARLAGISQLKPRLPDGTEAGTLSIHTGETVVFFNEAELLRVVGESTPEHVEDYVEPRALADKRVLDLLREHLPEFVGRRVTAERRAELAEALVATRGILLNLKDGEKVKVATVDTHEPTGKFAYTPGKPGTAAILAALAAGTVTEHGEIAPEVTA